MKRTNYMLFHNLKKNVTFLQDICVEPSEDNANNLWVMENVAAIGKHFYVIQVPLSFVTIEKYLFVCYQVFRIKGIGLYVCLYIK